MKRILATIGFVSLSFIPHAGLTTSEADSTVDFDLSLNISSISGWASLSGLTVSKHASYSTLSITGSSSKAFKVSDLFTSKTYNTGDRAGLSLKSGVNIDPTAFTASSTPGVAPTVGGPTVTLERYKILASTSTQTADSTTFTVKPLIMELDFAGASGLKNKPLYFVFSAKEGSTGSLTDKLDTSASSNFDGWFKLKSGTSGNAKEIKMQFKYACHYQSDSAIVDTCAKDGNASSNGIDIKGAQSTKLGVKWNPTVSSMDARHQKVFASFFPSKLEVDDVSNFVIDTYTMDLTVGIKVP